MNRPCCHGVRTFATQFPSICMRSSTHQAK
jgi:hypothetical protein